MQRNAREILNDSVIGIVGAVIGFLISQAVNFYSFSKTLSTTKDIQMVNLARQLSSDFEENKDFEDFRMAIERCDPLFNGWRWPAGKGLTAWQGRFNNDQVNRYLNFFDDIGFYNDRDDLNLDIVRQMFGPFIVEAYEEPEIRCYIEGLQTQAHQSAAFANFEGLARRLEASETDLAAFQRNKFASTCHFDCPLSEKK
jgi:hypothetical protein